MGQLPPASASVDIINHSAARVSAVPSACVLGRLPPRLVRLSSILHRFPYEGTRGLRGWWNTFTSVARVADPSTRSCPPSRSAEIDQLSTMDSCSPSSESMTSCAVRRHRTLAGGRPAWQLSFQPLR